MILNTHGPRKPAVNAMRWFYPNFLALEDHELLPHEAAPREIRGYIRAVTTIGVSRIGDNP